MKREDLTKLGLTEEQVDQIMALHGQDVEKQKQIAAEVPGLKTQLAEATKTIEGFKAMNIDQIKAAADEWKTKAEKAQADAAAQIADLKFNHALDGALAVAKARNAKAVRALLNVDLLKLTEDGSLSGLKEQLEKIKSENDYLFESDKPQQKLIAGGKTDPVLSDAVVNAARQAAGLTTSKE